ncbi:DUF3943 domain-containing protein [Mucilaginibacter jinjuensis]|uniref:DUF3943 domain-containing protein n=1 Tax=Mucilaginibacter jinjuensis TaxID=1176721 RepID=A0ABY7TF53_9SPHI|nr:DUF3943 domain-containing protein [Mucilaginibacter jinjuensis]WCT14951.1 DUF3943 domain-containing protein [Mucilaginibacter jinjuensis]
MKRAGDTAIVKKHFWRASGEWTLAQIIPWSYNYYVRDAEFAHITFASIGHNLKPSSWEWDDNNFTTNQIAHPYHGNLYFNAFRSNGYSFWQSASATVAGSLMWEIAGETHPPAPNDLINTSVGGIILGEMTYRISNRIINKRQRGAKRQASEIAAFLIDPMNGLNRLLDGKWGKVSTIPGTDLDTVSTIGEIDLGARQINERSGNLFTKGKTGWYARLRLFYGDPYTASKKPFNNFDIKVELGADDTAKLNNVSVNGLLSSWEIKSNNREDQIMSLTANYDFYHNAAFEYGAQSVTFSLYSRYFNENKDVKFNTRFGAGAVILAAVPDAYLHYGEGCDYDYGPGFSLLGQAGVTIHNRFAILGNYRGGWFATLNGNESTHFLHELAGEARYRIVKQLSFGAEGGYLLLHGYYKNYPDTNNKYPYVRISLGYKI